MSKNENMDVNSTKVITGVCRASYTNLNTPKSINGGKEKYSVTPLISKSDIATIEEIKAATRAAYEVGKDKLRGSGKVVPPLDTLKVPLRDGDVERPGDAAYANCFFLNANSYTKPGIIGRDGKEITDSSMIYSGIYCKFSLNFYAYNISGSKGIACGLGNVLYIKPGTPLGSRSSAFDDFRNEFDDDALDDEFLA
jgi:hypothetical protein